MSDVADAASAVVDMARVRAFAEEFWEDKIVPTLSRYIGIPCKSPLFDENWRVHGHIDAATALLAGWARRHLASIAGAKLEIVQLEERTPVIFIDLPGDDACAQTALLYGHLDKQPEMTGWAEGLGPWIPVRKHDRLYGRGGADDGYAIFGCVAAILALHTQRVARARCVILIEACEESGSVDLPFYMEHLRERIGEPSLVICLDSGCGNYEQLWLTTSLRGSVNFTLTASVLDEGVHSGNASGIVPSSFLVLRSLLDRLEDARTGDVSPQQFHCAIPEDRLRQAHDVAQIIGENLHRQYPLRALPRSMDPVELILNKTWRPQLACIGADGLPAPAFAGNVLRPSTSLVLSLRLPPLVCADEARAALRDILLTSPPFGAEIRLSFEKGSSGWNAPPLADWLERACHAASMATFREPAAMTGEGVSIPFMAMLGAQFPNAQFVVTGVLGPNSNAHGPNEFLHLTAAKHLTGAVAYILAAHCDAGVR